LQSVAARSAFTALAVLALLRAQGAPLSLPRATFARAIVIGLLLAAQSFCIYSAVAVIPVALALLAFNAFPMLLALFSWGTGGERPRTAALVAMPVALVGLALALDVFGKDVNGALGAAGDPGLVSCKSCHDPASGGADSRSKPNATSLGVAYTGRNAPTVINAAYSPVWQFWDGRVDSLWSQALAPPEGDFECNSGRLEVVHVIFDTYRKDYEDVFGPLPDLIATLPPKGKPGQTSFDGLDPSKGGAKEIVNRAYANFGKAIAAYERLLVSDNFEASKFDRFMNGDREAMSPAAIRGARRSWGRVTSLITWGLSMRLSERLWPSTTGAARAEATTWKYRSRMFSSLIRFSES